MKILRLKFLNINSLAGEWSIDFTAQAFNEGLFLICGPTGSGKSSVLDAILLALYGRTVRQDVSQSANEVMTRNTGECFSEIEFTSCGKTYRARWEQHRAYNKPNGNLQGEKHTLFDMGERKDISESRRGETGKKVAETVGLTFDQFTRTGLLAQGQFDLFLKSNDNDRSDILEQATGTAQFSEIGTAIFASFQKARDAAENAKTRCDAIETMTQEARDKAMQALREKQVSENQTSKTLESCRAELAWLKHRDDLHKSSETIKLQLEQTECEYKTLQPFLEKLLLAESARSLDLPHKNLEHAWQSLNSATKERQRRAREFEEAVAAYEKAVPVAQKAVDWFAEIQKQREEAKPRINEARRLDKLLAAETEKYNAAKTAHESTIERIAKLSEDIAEAEKKRGECQEKMSAAESFRSAEKGVSAPERFAKEKLFVNIEIIKKADAENKKMEAHILTLEAESKKLGMVFEEVKKEHGLRHEDLEKAVEDAREKQRLADKIKSLEKHRADLVKGRPCPLCGATEHPYAVLGDIPTIDEATSEVKKAEGNRKALENKLTDALDSLTAAEKTQREAEKRLEASSRKNASIITAVEKELATLAEMTNNLRGNIEMRKGEKLELEKAVAEGETNLWELKNTVEETQKLRDGTGVEDPEELDRETQRKYDAGLKKAQDCKNAMNSAKIAEDSARVELQKSQTAENTAKDGHEEENAKFQKLLDRLKFADVAEWGSARWDDAQIEDTRARRDELRTRKTQFETLQKKNFDEISEHEKQTLSERDPETVAAELDASEKALTELMADIADIEAGLKIDEAARRKRQRLEGELAKLEAETAKWNSLNRWLGGANGEQFKRYAQGITLRKLLTMANPHLAKITNGRYRMEWSVDANGDTAGAKRGEFLLPLIVDSEQGDERRPVSNLSGGETFQVSLALALGLSSMAAGGLKIDSLFLDEGFGTLDGEALGMALDTLSNIQRDGKLIGVISHIGEVRERIRVQIQASPIGGGRSMLSGAGVQS